jgi:hypothetical protein
MPASPTLSVASPGIVIPGVTGGSGAVAAATTYQLADLTSPVGTLTPANAVTVSSVGAANASGYHALTVTTHASIIRDGASELLLYLFDPVDLKGDSVDPTNGDHHCRWFLQYTGTAPTGSAIVAAGPVYCTGTIASPTALVGCLLLGWSFESILRNSRSINAGTSNSTTSATGTTLMEASHTPDRLANTALGVYEAVWTNGSGGGRMVDPNSSTHNISSATFGAFAVAFGGDASGGAANAFTGLRAGHRYVQVTPS